MMMFTSSTRRIRDARLTSTIHRSGKAPTGKKYKETGDVLTQMCNAV
jgi:hypothetical protein